MDRPHLIKLISEIISINAVNPSQGGKGEYSRAKFIENYFKTKYQKQINKHELTIKNYETKDGKNNIRPNLIVTISGSSKQNFWSIAHLDTVGAGNKKDWMYEPFKATFVNDNKRVYGRGINDNGLAIFANLILIDEVLSNYDITKPKYTLKFAFLSDEEDGSKYGMKYLLETNTINEFRKGDIAVISDAGNKKGDEIEIAEKGILWLKQECIGKQCHGSMPNKGLNAHYHNMRFAIKLYDTLHKKFNAKDRTFIPKESTFEITKKENNVEGVNIIPGCDVVYWDMRILPKYKLNSVLDFIKKEAKIYEKKTKVKLNFGIIQQKDASFTKENSKIVINLKKAIKSVLKVTPKTIGVGGGTFAGFLRNNDVDSAVWGIGSETEHLANEYELVENYYKIAEVFKKLIY